MTRASYGSVGGALHTRPDVKMGTRSRRCPVHPIVGARVLAPAHRAMLKRHATRKRRQRDRTLSRL